MSARAGCVSGRFASPHVPARIALLGVGNVGAALLRRIGERRSDGCGDPLSLVYVADSRHAARLWRPSAVEADCESAGLDPHPPRERAARLVEPLQPGPGEEVALAPSDPTQVARALADGGQQARRIVIDATASDTVASHHARWLGQGIDVVTACKLGQGTSLDRWRRIQRARTEGGSGYGDSATVGAGLPLLRTIRALRDGGDRIHAIAGVLSGSLAWLFNHYDGLRPFSGFVRQARQAGFTEPDPREDLSGEDVRRKLLILARTSGVELETGDVTVRSLVPDVLARLSATHVDAALPVLDGPLRTRFAEAWKRGERLRFIARLQNGRGRIGLESLGADDPLAGGSGTDNRVAIWSDRYPDQPLVIQGPGAGAGVTAAALLDDALALARRLPGA
ncbi:homoserine dehydrogenase [Lysobacter sp. A3-1-A15]|uniref:homoserine dehydrogenase n=1 Tax=Novilysobacter viscosus TaxID=3098602 RepID=UPI002ED802AE